MSKEEQSRLEVGENAKLNKNEDKETTLDDMLQHVGDMGRYQKLLSLGMIPFGLMFSCVYFLQMFITLTPKTHWCRVPELSHLDPELRRNLTTPRVGDIWDQCSMFVANWTEVALTLKPPHPNTTTQPCTHGWEFELTDIPYHTVVTERGWVCEYASYAPTAQAVFFAGSFMGTVFFGWLADTHGRLPALVGSTAMALVGSVATIFTTGFWDFTISRFIAGTSYDSIFMCTYILLVEYIGPRYRTLVANFSMALIFGMGCLLLPWVALLVADWRNLVWLTTLPLALIFVAPFTVPESARWLLTKGRVTDAVRMLRKFERVNGKKIPQDELDDFITTSTQTKQNDESVRSLLMSATLRKMMILLVLLYMFVMLVIDASVRLSEDLGLDFFLTFCLTSVTEIPSAIVLVMLLDRWGRRNMSFGPLSICAVVLFIGIFVPKGIPLVTMVALSRFLSNMVFSASLQWSTELLPTSVRASGSSIIHLSSFISSMFSPFVAYSGRIWPPLPLLILASLSLISAGISLLLPETMGKPLPQTFDEVERSMREYTLCGKSEDNDQELQYRKSSSP